MQSQPRDQKIKLSPPPTGVTGAKVQSWRAANPREVLKEILSENQVSDRAIIFSAFHERMRQDDADDYLESIIDYWLANNYYALVGPAPVRPYARKAGSSSETINAVAGNIETQLRKKIQEQAKIMLLEMVLPNGKALKDCTGNECQEMSARLGPWLAAVAERVQPTQLVGDALTEDQVRDLY
jgi:hypothetical protein